MSLQSYRALLEGLWDWSPQQAMAAAEDWWAALLAYIESDGDEAVLSEICGSPGEWANGADRLADWFMREGFDPYPFWDLFLAVDERLEEFEAVPIETIRRLSDRAILLYRRLSIEAGASPDTPTPKRAGRKPTERVKKRRAEVLRLHKDGLGPGDIASTLQVSAELVRQDIWRLRVAGEIVTE